MFVVVLGGGLSGLSAAFHLSRRFPSARIVLVNKDTRFGGWVRSERVSVSLENVQDVAHVLLEGGPRTIRPNALSVLELIHLLDLSQSLLTVPRSSAAAKNRFLCTNGSQQIHRIPSSPLEILASWRAPNTDLGRILFSAILWELFTQRNRPPGVEDESVDGFFTRRFGADFARVFGSALVHGIYAADARKLSLRSTFPSMWDAEERGWGSVLLGFLRPRSSSPPQPITDVNYNLGNLQNKMRKVSVYTFQDGIGTLVDALVNYLRKQPNVQLCDGVKVTGLRLDPNNGQFKLTTSSQETFSPTHVVSALPLPELHEILSPPAQLPHLTANTYSSVTVVNLVFRSPSLPLHPDGFGYLVPRPVDGYATANGSGILGCVFDSCSATGQDTPDIVKMAVMLGGPYVSDPPSSPQVDIPTLLSELSDQLGRSLPTPLFVKVHPNSGCIPLYTVGHIQRMKELKDALSSDPWNGRMEVVGAGVGGVSVGDCVEAGRNVGKAWG